VISAVQYKTNLMHCRSLFPPSWDVGGVGWGCLSSQSARFRKRAHSVRRAPLLRRGAHFAPRFLLICRVSCLRIMELACMPINTLQTDPLLLSPPLLSSITSSQLYLFLFYLLHFHPPSLLLYLTLFLFLSFFLQAFASL
jgi:hypothetical protein